MAGEGLGESPELGRESPEVLGRERLVGEGPGREIPELGRESGAGESPVSKCMGAVRPCGMRPAGSAQPSTGAERFEPSPPLAPPGEEPGRVARLPIVPPIEALLGEPPSVDVDARLSVVASMGYLGRQSPSMPRYIIARGAFLSMQISPTGAICARRPIDDDEDSPRWPEAWASE